MQRDPASERQFRAADPTASTWLSANAGSGKTRVLTDRVARLLLDGVDPQQILCLTYTKAAASEMQNRLFDRLGAWAMLAENRLRDELRALGIDGPVGSDRLAEARRLFARAIETPGGLKIQTIHSFCASLLRRFPLEAQVSPNFTEMDDRSARLLREEIVEELAAGLDVAAVDGMARLWSGTDFAKMTAEISRKAEGFAEPLSWSGAMALFDLPEKTVAADVLATVFLGGEAELIDALVPHLRASSSNDQKAAARLAAIDFVTPDLQSITKLERLFLYGDDAKDPFGAKIDTFPTKAVRGGPAAPLMPQLAALMLRVEAARQTRLRFGAAERTYTLFRFATAFLPIYEARKASRGWLDFDDLIARAGTLLSDRSVAQWVLFRLDGGISHVLVDEAQDTSPKQWTVIERLTQEFTSGDGARSGKQRTLFVVGDKKQSIYSFQGADLRAFDRVQAEYKARFDAAQQMFQSLTLEHSFRSAEAILRLVDAVFDTQVRAGMGETVSHKAFHDRMAGRVDLWPFIAKTKTKQDGDWDEPVDRIADDHHNVILARDVAAEIRRIIDSGTQIDTRDGPRPVHGGDILILVQRRSLLFHEIIRACKVAGLDVAGADRLRLGGELAVKDIGACLAFLATPEDDLALACALRSPLFGWSEAELFDLAAHRGIGEYLWSALRAQRDARPETLAIIDDMLSQADFLRPFDLIERLLTRHDGRRRLLARLGPEAQDGIDELLSQALAFERNEVPSLTGFLIWLETDDIEVKRQPGRAARSIRVMTVHGAKGLEAPIVILPDTEKPREEVRSEILTIGQGALAWKTVADESPRLIDAARETELARQREERMRLLYVALTRAEKWLIVCGAGEQGSGGDSWYSLVRDGMGRAGALADDDGTLRLTNGIWPDTARHAQSISEPPLEVPDWATRPATAAPEPERALSPSDLGGAKALPGEPAFGDEEAAKRHGRQLHLLLEHLPLWPVSEHQAIATALLTQGPDQARAEEIAPLLHEAARVLTAPGLTDLFSTAALAEVEFTARLPDLGDRLVHGIIDRLIVRDDHVLAIDYKSNAVVPASPAEVPPGILRQMGTYAAALAQIYPGRRIDIAVLWTQTAELMPIPPEIMRSALVIPPMP